MQEQFDALGTTYGLSRRGDVDRLIFQKLYGRLPKKESEILKIRYWRTGRHKPQSREQCLELGRALELDKEKSLYLIQAYYDGADLIFSEADVENPVYQSRIQVFAELEGQYMANAYPDTLERLEIPWEKPEPFVRHYYFQDALGYVSGTQWDKKVSHFSSANYVNEFQKNRRLLGEIPRKTILRHLFLMSAPFVSADVMDARLTALGYLPLSRGHESRWGERLDALILGLLEWYKTECTGKSPRQCIQWLQSTCRTLDERLAVSGHPELRFLNFKALKKSGSKT